MKKKQNEKNPAMHSGDPAEEPKEPPVKIASSMPSRPQSCVWNQGRLNLRKLCDLDRHCAECPRDKALSESAQKNRDARRQGKIPLTPDGRVAFTRERLKLLPQNERPCLLFANGLIDYKICCKNQECVFCEFDRYFSEQRQIHAVVRPLDVLNVRGFRLPQGYYFHMGHAWVRLEDQGDVSIGVDDFALRLFGPLDHIEVPLIGSEIQVGHAAIRIRRGSHTASIMAPVSGVISDINLSVKDNAYLAYEDPYASGWMLKVHTHNLRQDLKTLLIGGEYIKHLDQEIERLMREIEMVLGDTVPPDLDDQSDIAGQIPDIGWERLNRLFLQN